MRRKMQQQEKEMATFSNPPVSSSDSGFTRLRKRMVNIVASGTPFLQDLQKHRRNPLVHLWLRGSSALGGEARGAVFFVVGADGHACKTQISGATW